MVNDSEYSKSAFAKPILSPGCIYLVSPGARCCCCGSCGLLLLLLRAPTPPRPFILGEGSTKKKIASSVEGWRLDKFASAWARSEFYLRFSWVIIIMPGAISVGLRAQGHHPSWSFWMSLNVFSLAPGQRFLVLYVFAVVWLAGWYLRCGVCPQGIMRRR